MLERFGTCIQWGLILAMAAAAWWAWQSLPPGAVVPVHFNAAGEADGWMAAAPGLFFMPLLAVAMMGLQWLLPRIDPRGHNLQRSGHAVATVWVATTAVLAAAQGHLVLRAMGLGGPAPQLPLLLVGGLFMAVGNVLGKLRANFTVGIRTPWTLANERVWDQTHRFGGKAFVIAGGGLLLLSMSSPPAHWQGPAIVTAALVAAGLAVLKSYWLWRQQRDA